MQPLSTSERKNNLAELEREQFDVLVVGGGVTGAGVALDAATRGYKVALVEKTDFASGTSSKSTKLVHGGIRYLPNFDFALVHEALVERGLLLQNAPYLVQPVGFVLPIYKGDLHPVGMPFTTPRGIGLGLLLDAGLWLYDIMAGFRGVQHHRRLSRQKVLQMAPALSPEGLKEGFVYYDAQTNDARLTMALIRTAARYGATVANYAQVTSFVKEQGKITGARVCDTIGNHEIMIRARHIVNATGVYSEQVESLATEEPLVHVEPSKGVHLVLSREQLQLGDSAIVLPETEDKRILFIVPWESRAVFGTTDTGSGDLDHPIATHEDITYLLKYLNRYLTIHVGEEDIISSYVGYRPLVRPHKEGKGSTTAKLSRTHVVLQSPTGLVSIVGGKLTTYRRMAQDTVDVLSRRDGMKPVHPTQAIRLQGSAGWLKIKRVLESRAIMLGLRSPIIAHLGNSYGTEALTILDMIEHDRSLAVPLIEDLPYLRAEVLYACRYEMAMTPYDILARRTSITLEDRHRGLKIVNDIADLMAKELGWSSMQQAAVIDTYRKDIEGQMTAELV